MNIVQAWHKLSWGFLLWDLLLGLEGNNLNKTSPDARSGQDSSGEEDSDEEEPNSSTHEVNSKQLFLSLSQSSSTFCKPLFLAFAMMCLVNGNFTLSRILSQYSRLFKVPFADTGSLNFQTSFLSLHSFSWHLGKTL